MIDTHDAAADDTAIGDSLIEEAVSRLDMSARLEGTNHTLVLDARLPPDAEDIDGALLFLMRAAAELHAEIQASDTLADMEETLKDALKADDAHGIEDGLDVYRSLLSSLLADIWRGRSGAARLTRLSDAQSKGR